MHARAPAPRSPLLRLSPPALGLCPASSSRSRGEENALPFYRTTDAVIYHVRRTLHACAQARPSRAQKRSWRLALQEASARSRVVAWCRDRRDGSGDVPENRGLGLSQPQNGWVGQKSKLLLKTRCTASSSITAVRFEQFGAQFARSVVGHFKLPKGKSQGYLAPIPCRDLPQKSI